MVFKYRMSSCHTSICIESKTKLDSCFEKNSDFIDFPDLRIETVIDNEYTDAYCVKYEESETISLNYTSTVATLKCPFHETENANLLLFVGYPLLEAKRRRSNSFTFHGAGISIDGKGIVILGKEGAGKTTLSMNICKLYGAKLIGNDLCVLDCSNIKNPILLGGTKFVHLRYESICRNMPDKLNLFSTLNNGEDTWLTKKKVTAAQLNIGIETLPVNIQHFYIVHIDQAKELYHSTAKTLPNILYLNENFARYIRNTCTAMIIDNQLVEDIPSLDDSVISKVRYQFINNLFSGQMVTYVSGNIDDVTNYIMNSL